VLAEHQGGETEEIGAGILPRASREAGLEADFLQELGSVPMFFASHLRQQQTLMVAGVDQQAMLADADFLDIHDAAQRGENRDFVMQLSQFARRNGAEASVFERRHRGHVAHRQVQGLERRYVPDAAAELSFFGQRHERPALLHKRRQPIGGALVGMALADRSLHRGARDFEQCFLLARGE